MSTFFYALAIFTAAITLGIIYLDLGTFALFSGVASTAIVSTLAIYSEDE